jgi:hypothetical protein
VADTAGSNGKFLVRGRPCTDPAVRAEAAEAGYRPKEEYVVFELGVEDPLATEYEDGWPRYLRRTAADGCAGTGQAAPERAGRWCPAGWPPACRSGRRRRHRECVAAVAGHPWSRGGAARLTTWSQAQVTGLLPDGSALARAVLDLRLRRAAGESLVL